MTSVRAPHPPAAARPPARGSRSSAGRVADVGTALVPAGLVLGLGFNAGGFFPGATAVATIALAAILVLRITLADRPFAGLRPAFVAGAALLALLAVWTLVSSAWSDAPGRAVIEYQRVLLYLLAFVVVGAPGWTDGRARWLLRGLAAAILVVCAAALVARLAPGVWDVPSSRANDRLSYPLSYWNAMGLISVLGLIAGLCLSGDLREHRGVRVAAAAALPVYGTALMLSFSRGAMAVGAVGLLVAVLAARPGAIVSALLVAVPSVGAAMAAAYGADALVSLELTSPAALQQGDRVAVVLAVCVVAAAAARAGLLALDARLAGRGLPAALRRPRTAVALAAGALAAVLAAAMALDVDGALQRGYDRFVSGDTVAGDGSVRSRLADTGNNGRVDQWGAAIDAFETAPVRGTGAGTYALQWELRRPVADQAEDAHSLYAEILGELGIVGLLLVAAAVALMLGALLLRARGPDRVVAGALFGAAFTWAAHTGIDWDWELPAVTAWAFCAGGTALAAAPATGGRALGRLPRIVAALAVLLLAVLPTQVLRSQIALDDSRAAFARGDCPAAVDRALDSTEALGVRAEPFVILGYCDVRLGDTALAVRALENAVERDPLNWEYRYALALVRAADGQDPRPAARAALRRNPLGELAADAVRRFDTDDPALWRRGAARAPLPAE